MRLIQKTIMRYFILLFFISCYTFSAAQYGHTEKFNKDSLLIIPKNPQKGFYHDYILFIPKGTPLNKQLFLLVEPNNTGKLSDSIEVHTKHAIYLASVSSVGNNISTELKLPLLVPVFPRPASKPLMYTHALDRDVVLKKTPALKRLDLQLIAMIDDARYILNAMKIPTDPKIFMNGFSASATFTNRFSFMHPDKIQALAIGGFNGNLLLPQNKLNGVKLNYPIGTNDFRELFGDSVHMNAYKHIPQFIYMGKLDENDAVQFDDAYSKKERKLINEQISANVQDRYLACQKIYNDHHINASFKTYETVGHWTISAVNLEVTKFFYTRIQASVKN